MVGSGTMTASADPIAALVDLPGVSDAALKARDDVDALLWERSLREKGPALARESMWRGAQSNAALDGVEFAYEAWRSGDAFEASPIGAAAAGVLRMHRDLPSLVSTWHTAPVQAVARMHALVAKDVPGVDPDSLGRPRMDDAADDPLRVGVAPASAVEAAARLQALARQVNASSAPGIVLAAVVHGELLALRPFAYGSGLVARAAVRLVLADSGVDPDQLSAPEVGVQMQGRPAYVRAIRGYLSGTPEGVADWCVFVAASVGLGAQQARAALASL